MDQPPIRTPERSAEQRASALAHANRVRAWRANLWSEWRRDGRQDACVEAARLLEDPPAWLASCKVDTLLEKIPAVGPRKTMRIMSHFRVAASKTLAGLSPAKRTGIATFLREFADPVVFERRRRDRDSWPLG